MTRIIPGQSQPFRALTGHLRKMSLPLIAALALAPIPANADEVDAGIAVLQTICASAEAAGKLPSALAKPALDGLDSKVMAQVKAAANATAKLNKEVADRSAREKELTTRLKDVNERHRRLLMDHQNAKSPFLSKMQEIEGRKESLDAEIKTLTDQLNGMRQELKAEENKPFLDRTWGPAGRRINELQKEIPALEKDIARKGGEKRDLVEEISIQKAALDSLLAELFAKVGPISNEHETVNSALLNAMKELEAARKSQRDASLNQSIVEQAAGQARTCIQQAKGGGQQRGDAGGEETDYAAINKLGDEHRGSGGNPEDSQVVKKPVVPQEGYQGSGGGVGGPLGKFPIPSVMSPIFTPQPPGRPGPDWRGLTPGGGQAGGGSGGGGTGPTAKASPGPAAPPQQQGVRVNCYGACFNGCKANKGGSGYFQGMCAPAGPCYPTRVTADACSAYCAGYKQDILVNAGDGLIGVCGGGTSGAATNPPAPPPPLAASTKPDMCASDTLAYPLSCYRMCMRACTEGPKFAPFTMSGTIDQCVAACKPYSFRSSPSDFQSAYTEYCAKPDPRDACVK